MQQDPNTGAPPAAAPAMEAEPAAPAAAETETQAQPQNLREVRKDLGPVVNDYSFDGTDESGNLSPRSQIYKALEGGSRNDVTPDMQQQIFDELLGPGAAEQVTVDDLVNACDALKVRAAGLTPGSRSWVDFTKKAELLEKYLTNPDGTLKSDREIRAGDFFSEGAIVGRVTERDQQLRREALVDEMYDKGLIDDSMVVALKNQQNAEYFPLKDLQAKLEEYQESNPAVNPEGVSEEEKYWGGTDVNGNHVPGLLENALKLKHQPQVENEVLREILEAGQDVPDDALRDLWQGTEIGEVLVAKVRQEVGPETADKIEAALQTGNMDLAKTIAQTALVDNRVDQLDVSQELENLKGMSVEDALNAIVDTDLGEGQENQQEPKSRTEQIRALIQLMIQTAVNLVGKGIEGLQNFLTDAVEDTDFSVFLEMLFLIDSHGRMSTALKKRREANKEYAGKTNCGIREFEELAERVGPDKNKREGYKLIIPAVGKELAKKLNLEGRAEIFKKQAETEDQLRAQFKTFYELMEIAVDRNVETILEPAFKKGMEDEPKIRDRGVHFPDNYQIDGALITHFGMMKNELYFKKYFGEAKQQKTDQKPTSRQSTFQPQAFSNPRAKTSTAQAAA